MMKTRWTGSMPLLFALLAVLLLNQALDVPSAHAQDAEAEEPAPKKEAKSGPPYGTHTCPIIPIAVYGSDTLYQAYYFEDDDCDPYTITYVFGTFMYPRTCPNCGAYTRASRRFYGLAMPVPADYEHSMPAGKPRKYSKKALTPNRVRHLYLHKQRVYVKVFSFAVNRVDMANGTEPDNSNFRETIHFAFECSDPASIGVDPVNIEVVYENKVKPIKDPAGGPTTVYDVTYDYAGGSANILTFLCGDPEPPQDVEAEPTPANETPTPAAQ